MNLDSTYYEDIQGRLRGLLIELGRHFARDQAALISELIDANECGVALEMMSQILDEGKAPVPKEQVTEIARLGEQMDLPDVVRISGELNVG